MSNKILKLDQAQTLYQDLRERIDALPTDSDIPEVPVQDVQANGISILSNGIANIPTGSESNYGVVRPASDYGLQNYILNGNLRLGILRATTEVKGGTNNFKPITPSMQHESAFYGLAKAAGHDEKDSTEPLGTYTPEAKGAIQSMLGVSDLIATEENNLIASKAYKVGDVFTANGKLYKATAAIAVDAAIIPAVEGEEITGANCEETSVGDGFVKFTDYATNETAGVSIVSNSFGLFMDNGRMKLYAAPSSDIKNAIHNGRAITPFHQHESAFYGLAKAAGADEKDSTLPVGTYTDTAKTAIRTMLGATSNNVIAVQDTQPTDTDTKIWLPETAPEGVEVPTMADMNAALAGKVGDVQVDGQSVVSNGIAEIPKIGTNRFGIAQVNGAYGVGATQANYLYIVPATDVLIKTGTDAFKPIVSSNEHQAAFYGLAKAAGDTSQSVSSNVVGTYTDEAKEAIKSMLGIDLTALAAEVEIPLVETVTGTDITINGQPNVRYNCGEVSTITINPPAAGSIDVIFTSGTSVAVLTLPSTVKMPAWFDATTLETDTIYEILITDGVYGSVMTWAV